MTICSLDFRSYYFSAEQVANLFVSAGFQTLSCSYVERRTVNLKENINVPRIFVQAKFKKSWICKDEMVSLSWLTILVALAK